MKPATFACLFAVLLTASVYAAAATRTLTVDLGAPAKPISTDLFGIYFEDLNYAADGGLYAELIQNRSFEYSATEQAAWGPFSFWDLIKAGDGEGHLGLGDARPVHINNPHYLILNVLKPGGGVGIANNGFDQIPLEAGKAYEASFGAYQAFMGAKWGGAGPRVDQKKPMPMTVRLEGKDGSVLAEAKLEISGREWTRHAVTLTPSSCAGARRSRLNARARSCRSPNEPPSSRRAWSTSGPASWRSIRWRRSPSAHPGGPIHRWPVWPRD
jgi:hypothetical protein